VFPAAGRPDGRRDRRPGDVYSTPGIRYVMTCIVYVYNEYEGLHVRKRWSVPLINMAWLRAPNIQNIVLGEYN